MSNESRIAIEEAIWNPTVEDTRIATRDATYDNTYETTYIATMNVTYATWNNISNAINQALKYKVK